MTSRLQAKLLAQRALFQRLQSSKKRSKLQAGFTLVELLIVIVIIGILSAIAIPNFISQKDRAEKSSLDAWAGASARACSAVLVGDGTWADVKTNPPEAEYDGAPTNANTCVDTGDNTFTGGTKEFTVTETGNVTSADV
jgi:type IV pilus assembly protein PilA